MIKQTYHFRILSQIEVHTSVDMFDIVDPLKDMISNPKIVIEPKKPRTIGRVTFSPRAGKTLQSNCPVIRQGDEVYCPNCSLRWSLSEDRPECLR